jgi:hypothetical protein
MALPNQKTFLQFQQEISRELFGKTIAGTSDRPNLTEVKQAINDACQRVASSFDWSWMYRQGTFLTVIGQTDPYSLSVAGSVATHPMKVMRMTIPAQRLRLLYVPYERWQQDYPGKYSNLGNSKPTFYVPATADQTVGRENEIRYYLGPNPADAIYTIEWFAKVYPGAMTLDADIPPIPAQWQDLIKYKALELIYEVLGEGADQRLKSRAEQYQRLWNLAWKEDQQAGEGVNAMRNYQSEVTYANTTSPDKMLFPW